MQLSVCCSAVAPVRAAAAAAAVTTAAQWVWEQGVVCGVGASSIFTFSALQVKLTGGRVPLLQLCVLRSSLSLCTSLCVGLASRVSPLLGHRRHLLLLVLRGVCGTAAITLAYCALLSLPLGDAITLAQTRPPVTAVVAWALLGEPLGWRGAAGCVVSLGGVLLVVQPPLLFPAAAGSSVGTAGAAGAVAAAAAAEWDHRRLLGTAAGLCSPLFGSLASMCIRRIGRGEPALVVSSYFHLSTVALLAPLLAAGWPQHAALVAPHDAALVVGISSTSFLAQLLMTRAFQVLPAARAAAIGFLGVIWSHVMGAVVFGERLTSTTLMGGLLIFLGVLLVTVTPSSSSSSSSNSSGRGSRGSRGSSIAEAGSSKAAGSSRSAADGDLEAQQPLKPAAAGTAQGLERERPQLEDVQPARDTAQGSMLGMQVQLGHVQHAALPNSSSSHMRSGGQPQEPPDQQPQQHDPAAAAGAAPSAEGAPAQAAGGAAGEAAATQQPLLEAWGSFSSLGVLTPVASLSSCEHQRPS